MYLLTVVLGVGVGVADEVGGGTLLLDVVLDVELASEVDDDDEVELIESEVLEEVELVSLELGGTENMSAGYSGQSVRNLLTQTW